MLVLSRHENEAIVIDGQIKVTVVRIRGDKIRLGIEAPKESCRLAGGTGRVGRHQEGIGRGLNRGRRSLNRRQAQPVLQDPRPMADAVGSVPGECVVFEDSMDEGLEVHLSSSSATASSTAAAAFAIK